MNKKIIISIFALLISALACNLPGGAPVATPTSEAGPDAAFTMAAQTVEAELTQIALAQPTPAPPELPSSTPEPAATLTPVSSPTITPIPCNLASFVADVTIPDGSNIVTGSSFTKTWRLKNTGSCAWNSSYALVFDRGEKMSGPDSQPLSGNVIPGQTVDISVNLTAPGAVGNYRGHWRLRDGAGVQFGLSTGSFWVDIKAVAPSPTPTATTAVILPPAVVLIEAPLVASESGSARSDGSVLEPRNVGDVESNVSSQAFLSFDISSIPTGATIVEVKVDFSNYDMLGDPFALGCLRIYPQNYGALDSGDFFTGSATGAVSRWCNADQLSTVSAQNDIKATIQSVVGSSRAQFRAQFNENTTNSNGIADMVRLGNNLKLIVTYNPP